MSKSINSERAILKDTIDKILIKLNNYLIAADMKQRYILEWKKGDKEIVNDLNPRGVKNYYTLELFINEEDGNKVGVYGGHYPIKGGTSMIWVNEAETQAYKDLLTHAIGTLISVQHGMFLQLRKQEEEKMQMEQEKKANKPSLLLSGK